MNSRLFEMIVGVLGAGFAAAFTFIVMPPLIASGDLMGALAAGFVNPYAAGYSLDAIFCGLILIAWVLYERTALGVRHGWIVIPLSLFPGVAVAFATYLVIRSRQSEKELRRRTL